MLFLPLFLWKFRNLIFWSDLKKKIAKKNLQKRVIYQLGQKKGGISIYFWNLPIFVLICINWLLLYEICLYIYSMLVHKKRKYGPSFVGTTLWTGLPLQWHTWLIISLNFIPCGIRWCLGGGHVRAWFGGTLSKLYPRPLQSFNVTLAHGIYIRYSSQ